MSFLKEGFGWIIANLYDITNVYSLSIILMTIIFNILMLPLAIKQIRSTENMQKIQPQVQAVQKKYKNDKETMNKKVMELYQKNGVNPLAGCLPVLIQFPIIIALFGVLREPLIWVFSGNLEVGKLAVIEGFLWIKDLSQPDMLSVLLPNLDMAQYIPGILPIITSILTYVQMEISTPKTQANDANPSANAMGNMKYIFPVMILVFSRSMSSGLVLYWVTGTLFRICQQLIMRKMSEKKEVQVVK